MGRLSKLRIIPRPHPANASAPKRSAGDGATPMLRQLRTKFIALNMALAALVLAASFATICYADYRADIDDVHNRLMAATNRSLHEPQLIPDAEPLHRARASKDRERLTVANTEDDGGRVDDGAASDVEAGNAEDATSGNAGAGESAEGGSAPTPTQDIGAGTSDPGFAPPRIGGPGTTEEASLPVAVYYIADRTVMQLTDRSGATVPEALLVRAIPEVVSTAKSWGYLPDVGLYFAKHEAGPDLMVAFADGGAADGWRSLALVLTAVGLGALGLLFLLNLVFSRCAASSAARLGPTAAVHRRCVPRAENPAHGHSRQQRHPAAARRRHHRQPAPVDREHPGGSRAHAAPLCNLMPDLARPAPEGARASEGPAGIVDLSRLVEGEALTFEAVAFERELMWEYAIDKGITVRGNATRLQRAVAVLLDNACKYTNAGGTVTVTLRAHASEAVLSVRNSGEPIDEADLPHLFDCLSADAARTHNAADAENNGGEPGANTGGYGLGLAIARDIAQAHKGTIAVTSTAQEGTTFTLRLPLA